MKQPEEWGLLILITGSFLQYFSYCLRAYFDLFCQKIIINKTKLHFIYLALGTGLLINWQNLITGKYVFFSIHYLQPSYLFVIIALGMLLSELQFPKQQNKKNIAILILVIVGAVFIISMLFYKSFDGIKLVLP